MRLAIFTDTYEPEVNGVARSLAHWTSYLRRKGVACQIFAPVPDDSRGGIRQAASPALRFASLPFYLYPECRLALPNPLHIRRALHSFRPTLIHVATPFNLGLCGIHYANKLNIPLIASYHTHFDRYLPFYNLQWMEKLLWRYLDWFHQDCSRIFVPSRSVRRELIIRGWEPERLAIWGRGVDTHRFHPRIDRSEWLAANLIEPDSFVVLYAGRMAPEKEVDVAIESFGLFQRKNAGKKTVLVLVGDGPSAAELKNRCKRDGIDARFAGFRPPSELQKWYAAADVFLFPSPTETFGNVVLEAMACGTPVICADSGGVTDTVSHRATGLLCESGNAQRFAEALDTLYRDKAGRAELAAKARAYSLRQSWDSIFSQLHKSCESVTANGRSPYRHIAN